jgi:N-acetylglucosamine-6-phosphate deacetylase
MFLFKNALLSLPDRLVPGSLLVEGRRIAAVFTEDAGERGTETGDAAVVDCGGGILAPGFIDLHCHGGADGDANDGTQEAYDLMEDFHRRNGVTSWLPSLSVDPMDKLEAAITFLEGLVKKQNEGAMEGRIEILGVHYESPYINPTYRGCQALERLLPFDGAALAFIARHRDIIRRITVAPELPGVLEAIPQLRAWGIVVSGGHSAADSAEFSAAIDAGMTMTTHLYNAMSSVRKEGPFRKTGALEAALTDDRLSVECIADGFHVPAPMLKIAWRCKGPERFCVCSDASRAAGLKSGRTCFICGQEAIVEDGVAMTADRTSLASSTVSLDTMVRNLVFNVGLSVPQAVNAASLNPARIIGADHRKGKLQAGYDADLVLLDNKTLRVEKVWCRGMDAP